MAASVAPGWFAARSLCQLTCIRRSLHVSCVSLNSNRTSITRIHRPLYARLYPTTVVQPDGSTISIRYKEPRRIIKLPLDLSLLTDEEKAKRLAKRRPKPKAIVDDEIGDTFKPDEYSHLWKK